MVRKRRECFQHSECTRGNRCSAEGHCEPCEELAGNCVRLEEFGGLFGTGPFHDGEEEEAMGKKGKQKAIHVQKERFHDKDGHHKHGSNNSQASNGGIEQIFSALTMLRKAALDRLIGRPHHSKNSSASEEPLKKERVRREVKSNMEKNQKKTFKNNANKNGLPQGHRLAGEPCSPGHICLNGTVCEDGHCKCPEGKVNHNYQFYLRLTTILVMYFPNCNFSANWHKLS